jgi:hypothetical protein
MNRPNRATILTAIGFAVVLGALSICVVFGPLWIVGDETRLTAVERLRAETDARATLLQSFVGFLALGGVVLGALVTLGQVRETRKKNATDLYVKAVELLASDQLSVRHGGVYALEQLANLDISDDYRGNVHALLTAFIRQRVPWPPDHPDTEPPTTTRPLHGGAFDDIGAALGVLSRHKQIFDGYSELERVDLRGAELDHLDLTRSCFAYANLEGASLANTALTDSTLTDANLRSTNLTRADLSGADLSRADLTDADLHGVITSDTTTWPDGFTPPQPTRL